MKNDKDERVAVIPDYVTITGNILSRENLDINGFIQGDIFARNVVVREEFLTP
jgi:cytoskeletal protein CcmA (bactofilin family)